MKVQTQYGSIPSLIQHYMPEYKQHHHDIHGRNIDSLSAFKSILQDEHYQVNKMVRKIIKGAILGAVYGYAFEFVFRKNVNQLVKIHQFKFGNSNSLWRRIRGYTAYGGLMGLAWFFIYDKTICPHGRKTLTRHLAAYSIGGGLLAATLYHPGSFLYGSIFGFVVGNIIDQIQQPRLLQNFVLNLTNFDIQKRRIEEIKDTESSLSRVPSVFERRKFEYL